LRLVTLVGAGLVAWTLIQYGFASAAPFLLIFIVWAILVRYFKRRGYRF
jgi:hypothetical protein